MNYKLILDFGNTLKKAAVFQEDKMLELRSTDGDIVQIIEDFKRQFPDLKSAILSSVVNIDLHLMHYLKSNFTFLLFDHHTKIPIQNSYATPESLGKDRLAAAVGAQLHYPHDDVLIIDAGSSITYELKSKDGDYRGGAISPGILMRARALNHFTDQLPLVKPQRDVSLLGKDTRSSLLSGIVNGTIAEVSAMIDAFQNQYDGIKIILTGGDVFYFEKSLNYDIFASENLVLQGLNYILDYNEL